MSNRKNFETSDIGGNILPILTEGLYTDPLDALREYIQNSIDADCTNITIDITPHTVSLQDDGIGMDRDTADLAIKLGISRKDPLTDVGFRGIGIYSGFNIAERLEVYSKTLDESTGSKIVFEFDKIKKKLEEEDEARDQGKEPSLFLQPLLTDSVYVDDDTEGVAPSHGTKLILVGIYDRVYQRLNSHKDVVGYLQSTVPLPFHPEFKYSKMLTELLEEQNYKMVNLAVRIGGKRTSIYKPYYNDLFARKGEIEPRSFKITGKKTREIFGVAWVCHNDIRRVLKDAELRGLLITKKGFAIGNRGFLERFFPRVVFNRRITGEIIIKHDRLKPNAGRSDFEANETRERFILAIQNTIMEIASWADTIQNNLKAQEVLGEVSKEAYKINEGLPSVARDVQELLAYNTKLDTLVRTLKPHQQRARKINPELLEKINNIIEFCRVFIKESISEKNKQPSKAQKRTTKSVLARDSAPTKEQTELADSLPSSLFELMESLDLLENETIKKLMKYIDDTIIRPRLRDQEYFEEMENLQDFIEEYF